MTVNGKTKITGIFGYPIEHTLSPLMHNSAFEELGLDICYVPFRVHPDELPRAVQAIRSLNLVGVNITVPHKEKVIPFLDEVSGEASFIGAVNTITSRDGVLTGYNTDGRGFLSSLAENGISIEGKNIFIAGAGGASRAISYYLSEKAAKLSIFDIDSSRLQNLCDDLEKIRDNIARCTSTDSAAVHDIIINATPLGMKENDPLPINPSLLTAGLTVCDLVYKKTPLLKEAEKAGAKTMDGSGMLLWQGVLAFELWTGVKPPVNTMRKVLVSNIG